MKYLILLLSSLLILREAVGPPVTTKKGEEGHEENEVPTDEYWGRDIKYQKYLKEVVQALESDPQFKEKLEKAEAVDIRTGKIARELEFVNHHVRTKLDELKRQELERLRHLAVMQYNQEQLQRFELGEAEATGGGHRTGERQKLHIAPHLDHKNPHTFEVEDLRKLIVETTKELEEADRKRREEFKQYELQKEFEKQELLRRSDSQTRVQLEKDFKEMEEKHKNHPELHHPGSKQQLEEVWQEQDHMNPEDFNPKTFFHMHDLDGNGVWDADEVKTLFQKELDKMYDPSAFEDDNRERQEEMERMREHVFNESDSNNDRLISYDEFLAQTKKTEFEQDQGWEGLDHTPAYTHEEYEAFERQRQEEVRKLVEQGLIPPQPVMPNQGIPHGHPSQQEYYHGNQIPNHHPMASNQAYHAPPPHLNQPPQAYQGGQVQYHPAATNHVPQQQQHPGPGYSHGAGHHGGYQNQAVPHPGYPPQHPQVAHQGYAQHQQGYNQHQQPAPPGGPHQGQGNPGGPPHGPGSQQQQPMHHQQQPVHHQQQPVHQQQQPIHQQQQPIHQQQQPVHQQQQPIHQQPAHPQPVVNQQQVVGSHQVGDAPQAAQHQQDLASNLNNHNENSQPLNPNVGSVQHGLEVNANPSLANNQNPHGNGKPHSASSREQVDQQNKVPSSK